MSTVCSGHGMKGQGLPLNAVIISIIVIVVLVVVVILFSGQMASFVRTLDMYSVVDGGTGPAGPSLTASFQAFRAPQIQKTSENRFHVILEVSEGLHNVQAKLDMGSGPPQSFAAHPAGVQDTQGVMYASAPFGPTAAILTGRTAGVEQHEIETDRGRYQVYEVGIDVPIWSRLPVGARPQIYFTGTDEDGRIYVSNGYVLDFDSTNACVAHCRLMYTEEFPDVFIEGEGWTEDTWDPDRYCGQRCYVDDRGYFFSITPNPSHGSDLTFVAETAISGHSRRIHDVLIEVYNVNDIAGTYTLITRSREGRLLSDHPYKEFAQHFYGENRLRVTESNGITTISGVIPFEPLASKGHDEGWVVRLQAVYGSESTRWISYPLIPFEIRSSGVRRSPTEWTVLEHDGGYTLSITPPEPSAGEDDLVFTARSTSEEHTIESAYVQFRRFTQPQPSESLIGLDLHADFLDRDRRVSTIQDGGTVTITATLPKSQTAERSIRPHDPSRGERYSNDWIVFLRIDKRDDSGQKYREYRNLEFTVHPSDSEASDYVFRVVPESERRYEVSVSPNPSYAQDVVFTARSTTEDRTVVYGHTNVWFYNRATGFNYYADYIDRERPITRVQEGTTVTITATLPYYDRFTGAHEHSEYHEWSAYMDLTAEDEEGMRHEEYYRYDFRVYPQESEDTTHRPGAESGSDERVGSSRFDVDSFFRPARVSQQDFLASTSEPIVLTLVLDSPVPDERFEHTPKARIFGPNYHPCSDLSVDEVTKPLPQYNPFRHFDRARDDGGLIYILSGYVLQEAVLYHVCPTGFYEYWVGTHYLDQYTTNERPSGIGGTRHRYDVVIDSWHPLYGVFSERPGTFTVRFTITDNEGTEHILDTEATLTIEDFDDTPEVLFFRADRSEAVVGEGIVLSTRLNTEILPNDHRGDVPERPTVLACHYTAEGDVCDHELRREHDTQHGRHYTSTVSFDSPGEYEFKLLVSHRGLNYFFDDQVVTVRVVEPPIDPAQIDLRPADGGIRNLRMFRIGEVSYHSAGPLASSDFSEAPRMYAREPFFMQVTIDRVLYLKEQATGYEISRVDAIIDGPAGVDIVPMIRSGHQVEDREGSADEYIVEYTPAETGRYFMRFRAHHDTGFLEDEIYTNRFGLKHPSDYLFSFLADERPTPHAAQTPYCMSSDDCRIPHAYGRNSFCTQHAEEFMCSAYCAAPGEVAADQQGCCEGLTWDPSTRECRVEGAIFYPTFNVAFVPLGDYSADEMPVLDELSYVIQQRLFATTPLRECDPMVRSRSVRFRTVDRCDTPSCPLNPLEPHRTVDSNSRCMDEIQQCADEYVGGRADLAIGIMFNDLGMLNVWEKREISESYGTASLTPYLFSRNPLLHLDSRYSTVRDVADSIMTKIGFNLGLSLLSCDVVGADACRGVNRDDCAVETDEFIMNRCSPHNIFGPAGYEHIRSESSLRSVIQSCG